MSATAGRGELEEGGFAGAIASEQTHHVAGGNFEANTPERDVPRIGFREV